jgi:hypothetical protein
MRRTAGLGAGCAGLPSVDRVTRQTHPREVELVLVSVHDEFVAYENVVFDTGRRTGKHPGPCRPRPSRDVTAPVIPLSDRSVA